MSSIAGVAVVMRDRVGSKDESERERLGEDALSGVDKKNDWLGLSGGDPPTRVGNSRRVCVSLSLD